MAEFCRLCCESFLQRKHTLLPLQGGGLVGDGVAYGHGSIFLSHRPIPSLTLPLKGREAPLAANRVPLASQQCMPGKPHQYYLAGQRA